MTDKRKSISNSREPFAVIDTLLIKYNGNASVLRLPGFIFLVGRMAFQGNQNLTALILSSNVTAIGEKAFYGCGNLERVELPFGLEQIGKDAFRDCHSLSEIMFNGNIQRWLAIKKGENWLDGTPDLIISCKDGVLTKNDEFEWEAEPQVNLPKFQASSEKSKIEKDFDFEFIDDEDIEDLDDLINSLADDCTDDGKASTHNQSFINGILGKTKESKEAVQNLVNVISCVAEKMNAPISCESIPDWSLWNYEDFEEAVIERLERIIKSDRRMGRQGAIKKAETYLEAVRDTHDRKMVQVYERIVYEFKTASDYIYRQLKKQIFNEGE